MINWQQITTYIPIAIASSVIIFLVRFFGKAISDQTPYADDRKWLEEISGVKFFTGYILSPLIWVMLWYSRGWKFWLFPKEDIWLLILSVVMAIISAAVILQSSKFFKNNDFDEGDITLFFKKAFNFKDDIKLNKGDWVILLKFFILSLVSFGTIVLLIFFYKWQAYYQLAAGVIYLFSHLTFFALLSSLSRKNILLANIRFNDKKIKPLTNCRVLKVNNDSVRVRIKNNVSIINKSSILKIDIIHKKIK
jgi:hypothetical protein